MITLNKLVIGYRTPLTNPMDFVFQDGKVYGILGPSGCGKSTLLKTIADMHPPLSGSLENNGNFQIYMMHQRYTNFNWLNCLDNILIAERNRRKRKELAPVALDILSAVHRSVHKRKIYKLESLSPLCRADGQLCCAENFERRVHKRT